MASARWPVGVKPCRHHAFAELRELRRRNRRRGLCRCGADPTLGRATCARCRSVDAARRRRQRLRVRGLPDRALYATAMESRRDSPGARELRRRARKLPLELRHYGPHGLLMPSDDEMRARLRCGKAETVLARTMPGFDTLSGRLQAFVRALATNGGNRTAAALAAGYGAVSASRGGRAAAVAGCRIAKRPYIVAAVVEYRARFDRQAAYARELERRRYVREQWHAMMSALAMFAAQSGPQSSTARLLRRMRHEPVSRKSGLCRCGAPVSEGFASCAGCRARERRRGQHRRVVFGHRINAWRRAHRGRIQCTETAQRRTAS